MFCVVIYFVLCCTGTVQICRGGGSAVTVGGGSLPRGWPEAACIVFCDAVDVLYFKYWTYCVLSHCVLYCIAFCIVGIFGVEVLNFQYCVLGTVY